MSPVNYAPRQKTFLIACAASTIRQSHRALRAHSYAGHATMNTHVEANRRRGFTLIELLVVVSIIALLIAILLPSLKSARERSRIVVCQANQHQMTIANFMYADANNDYYVPINGNALGLPIWSQNKMYMSLINAKPGRPDQLNGLECPSAPDGKPLAIPGQHHGVHYNIYGWNWTNVSNVGYNPTLVRRLGVTQPADTAQLVDGTDWHIHMNYANYNIWDVYGETRLWSVAYRHDQGNGANITHFDGHGSYYTKYDAWPVHAEGRKRLWYVYKH
ncbi:MAG: prepilin-type N-terminal cleavage/methylation domain-containing protein [Phycisphaera sp.]|nr:prepilin-type N-terminal cleavage/methylation domain-containing protein [Phycisphaera sp.]